MLSLILNKIKSTQKLEQAMKFEVEKIQFFKNTCIRKEFCTEKEPLENLP